MQQPEPYGGSPDELKRVRGEVTVSLLVEARSAPESEISALLGVEPSNWYAQAAVWVLDGETRPATEMADTVVALLSLLPEDRDVWEKLRQIGQAYVRCGVFALANVDIFLSPEWLEYLADRGVTLNIDFYPLDESDLYKEDRTPIDGPD